MEKNPVNTSFRADPDLWATFKSAVALRGQTIQSALESLIRSYLKDDVPKPERPGPVLARQAYPYLKDNQVWHDALETVLNDGPPAVRNVVESALNLNAPAVRRAARRGGGKS